MKIDFQVLGEDTAALHTEEIGARALDMRPALEKVQALLFVGEREQFASQGSFFGSRWLPLADSTVAKKGSSEIMVATSALRDSLTKPGRRSRVTRSSVSLGTDVWYARFAKGTSRGEPARQIVGMTATELRAALGLIFRYLVEGLV